jgi:hypothetical protein
VYHRQAYDEEQIGHFSHGHGIGSVAHDAEDAEQSQSYAHRGLASVHAHHEIDQEEDGYGHEHESEVEIVAMTLAVVEEVDDGPVHYDADKKPNERAAKG